MKKRFIFGLLGAAVVAMGSFVSCNDKEEDRFLEFQEELKGEVDDMLVGSLTYQDLANKVEALSGKVGNLEAALADVQAAQAKCKSHCDSLETVINNLKQELGDNYVTNDALDQALADALREYATLTEVETRIQAAITQLTAIINGPFGTGENKMTINELVDNYFTLQNDLSAATAKADAALTLAQQDSVRIDGLDSAVDSLMNVVGSLGGEILTLSETLEKTNELAQAAKTLAENDSARIDALEADYLELSTKLDELKEDMEKYVDDQIADLKEDMDAKLLNLQRFVTSALANVMGEVEFLKVRVAALEEQVEDILDRLTKVEEILDNLVTSVVAQGTVNPVFGSFALPVGIRSQILAGYYGTAEDYVEFPTNDPTYFAAGDDSYEYVSAEKLLDPTEKIQMGTILVSNGGQAGNAGTLYLTVNGTYKDINKVDFSLVTSKDEASAITLGKLAPSDKELNFGVGRADNNFFEAAATLEATQEAIDAARIKIDKSAIVEVAKDILHYQDGINVTNAVTTLYSAVQDIMPAYAVKASWTDSEGKDHNVYSQYALAATAVHGLSYSFAKGYAPSTVPGLDRLQDLVNSVLDQIDLESMLGDVFDALDNLAGVEMPNLDNWTITIPELSEDTKTQLVIEAQTVNYWIYAETTIGEDGPETTVSIYDSWDKVVAAGHDDVLEESNPSIHIEIDGVDLTEAIDELYGNIQDGVNLDDLKSDLESFFNSLEGSLNDLAGLRDKVTIDNIVGDLKDKLEKYINAINKRFAKFLNPNAYLQPILLAQTPDGFVRLSGTSAAPTYVSAGDLVVTPTSYTNEIFAPAVKRYMKLYEVGGETLYNEVIDGTENDFGAVKVEAGKSYVIIYEALDFSGKVIAKKAYVTVK